MASYQEETVSGISYIRPRGVYFELPLEGNASVLVKEEHVLALTDQTIVQPYAELNYVFTDLNVLIPLYDPLTGLPVPDASITCMELYAGLYSVHRFLAAIRDAQ
jgi:hypothetical protein